MYKYPQSRMEITAACDGNIQNLIDRHTEGDMEAKYRVAHLIGLLFWTILQPKLDGGTSIREDGESWYLWRVFPKGTTDDEIREVFGTQASYGGPGRVFYDEAYIVRKGSRVLAKQYGGLDI